MRSVIRRGRILADHFERARWSNAGVKPLEEFVFSGTWGHPPQSWITLGTNERVTEFVVRMVTRWCSLGIHRTGRAAGPFWRATSAGSAFFGAQE